MTDKHTLVEPETALPWELDGDLDLSGISHVASFASVRDGEYAAHACNAYPDLATRITALEAERAELVEALERIAGRNDLSAAPDDEIESYARGALYECELIARATLAKHQEGQS